MEGDCCSHASRLPRQVSIPVLHSAAALLRIAEMPYTGANTVFILTLLDKKYALPLRVSATEKATA